MEAFVRTSDGASLWTTTSGHGHPIVLLSGGPGMADYLQPVSDLLGTGYQVHRYEPRGCGRSSHERPYNVARAVADLEDLRRHWKHERWSVIGHSWGVDLGLAYALKTPDAITALIGLSGGRVHNDRTWHDAYQQNRHKEEIPAARTPPNMDANRELMDDWRMLCRTPKLLLDLSRLRTRSLFIQGENDIRPSWPTEQLSHLMPNAKYAVVPAADHMLWQGNPAALKDILENFLAHAGTQE